jgi:hypothetical protein
MKSKLNTIKVYLTISANTLRHLHEDKDFGMGHSRHNHGSFSYEKNGKAAGEYHSVSSVIAVDKATHMDTRDMIGIMRFPEGNIITHSTLVVPSDPEPKFIPEWSHEQLIIAGTGSYVDIKGKFLYKVDSDGKHLEGMFLID